MFSKASDELFTRSRRQLEPRPPSIECVDDVVGRAYEMLAESTQFHGRSRSFRIVNSTGVLTVDGIVPSFYLKQLLQELLKRVDGVQYINNQVDVVALDELSSVRNRNSHSLRSRPH
jgi:hypothetical protein